MNNESGPVEMESAEVPTRASVRLEGSDVIDHGVDQESPASSSTGTNASENIPPCTLGGREAIKSARMHS